MAAPLTIEDGVASLPGGEISLETAEGGGQRISDIADLDDFIKDYLHKMQNFDESHPDDIVLDHDEFQLLSSCVGRFQRIQEMVGHGNFYLLSFDEALQAARQFSSIGAFTAAETAFLERVFHTDAAEYGFMGDKPLKDLTRPLEKNDIVKIPYTGNWLYRGAPERRYQLIKETLGDRAILTSGVRSIVKQFLLFLSKALNNQGNLSLASRSLAPPGYSFHGVGDFDVGKKGLGADNFTAAFTSTDVFKELADKGFVVLRYPRGNMLGVRFEPWHIKVDWA